MFSINNFSYQCPKNCKNTNHGSIINAALTKEFVTDEKLAAFVAKSCRNFAKVVDDDNCTALHIAVASDRCTLAEWLLNHNANVNAQLKKKGHTPLQKALNHGNVEAAVLLIGYGAKINFNDQNNRDVFQCCNQPSENFTPTNSNTEIVVWGNNKNYNLGTINNYEGKHDVQHLKYFEKLNAVVTHVSLSRYHCLYLTDKGNVYAVGHGEGGRLGNGLENTILTPELIKFENNKKVELIAMSAARDHSLVLSNNSTVFSCGSNLHHQLGYKKSTNKQLVFKEVEILNYTEKSFSNVIARNSHSIVYSNKTIYVWGLNCGQFGIKQDITHVVEPMKLFTFDLDITHLESNDNAIVVYSLSARKLFMYHNFKIKKVPTPKHQLIRHFCINNETAFKIVLYMEFGDIFIWYEDIGQYVKCKISLTQNEHIQKILWFGTDLLVNLKTKVCFGSLNLKNVNATNSTDYQIVDTAKSVCSLKECEIAIKRISCMDRIQELFCDPLGTSFIALQEDSKRYLDVAPMEIPEINFERLLEEADETDFIHDVVFHFGDVTFPVHKYLIFSKSKTLKEFIENSNSKHIYVDNNLMTATMFRKILRWIYCNQWFSLADIESNEGVKSNIVERLLKEIEVEKQIRSKNPLIKLNRKDFPELHNVTIQCVNKVEIKAHKCVLVARMEYFRLMFSNRWSEESIANLSTVPVEYMEIIINFLYTNDVSAIQLAKYTENFLYNMIIICDQYFIDSLKSLFEHLVIEKLCIKKCGEMLAFACAYNCINLRKVCLDFIIQNIVRVLEYRVLEGADSEVLKVITLYYRSTFKKNKLSEKSNAVDDNILENSVKDFTVDLNYKYLNKSKVKDSKNVQTKRCYEKIAINHSFDDELLSNKSSYKFDFDENVMVNDVQSQNETVISTIRHKNSFKGIHTLASIDVNEDLKTKDIETFVPLKSKYVTKSEESNLYIDDLDSNFRRKNTLQDWMPIINTKYVTETSILSIEDDSFAKIIKSPQENEFVKYQFKNTIPQNDSTVFTNIVENEKRRREYNKKQKTKPFSLTQIEEVAIAEFKDFYNIETLYDEVIKIDRRQFVD